MTQATTLKKTGSNGQVVLDQSQKVSGGHLVAKALKNEGIDTIFTLCGGHIIDIYDGCIDEGIRIIDVRHEQVAAHAADGYARQTLKTGCVVTTAGPGCTNAVTGIANAFRAESPVLHIGGQGALSQHKMGSLQDLPHVDLMTPITKFSAGVRSTERIADMVSMACRESNNGAPGPSYLEIPRDILDAEVNLNDARIPAPGAYRASTNHLGDPADIDQLATLLTNAKRPCALFGTQVWTSGSTAATIDFIRAFNLPAYFNGSARGTLPPGDVNHFHRTRRSAFNNADLILIVGTPFDFRMGYGRRLRADATVVQIDLDYRTVGKNRDISLGLVGNPGTILKAVTEAAGNNTSANTSERKDWLSSLQTEELDRTDKLKALFLSERKPIHPYRVAWEINNFLTEDTIYIGDGGDVVTISAQAVQPRTPGHWMDPGPLGTLGVGTSFSMASKLAHPHKEVLCYYGDGSFGMTAFDMETANRFGAPYIAVIGNNSAMNQIRYGQIAKYGEERGDIGNLLGDVPFSKFAEMLGGYGEEVHDPDQISPAMLRAREAVHRTGKSAVINIWVDPSEYAPGTKAQTMYK